MVKYNTYITKGVYDVKISLIIPCFNEESSLSPFYEELNRVTEAMDKYEFELLFIDDGSTDSTLQNLIDLAANDFRVKYISFSKNFGKEAAMYAGFCNCTGDYAAVMDADMQDPPSLLPKMVEILEQGEYDSVATRRMTRSGEPKIRSFFANAFYKIINKISDTNIVSGARDFRLMKREMVDAIVSMCENNRFSKGIFGWIGFKTYWLPFENVERVAGTTKWSFYKLFNYSLNGIVSFSDFPIKLSSFFGVLLLIASLGTFVSSLLYNHINGFFPSSIGIASLILLCSGIQLIILGIVGKYISNIYREVQGRPHYIVAKTNKENVVKK